MWGNSLGWGISAVIVAVTVSSLVWVSRTLNTISDPTDFSTRSGAADPIAVPAAPPAALPDDAGAADSAALYHQAIDLFQQDGASFELFASHPSEAELSEVEPAVELLRKAAGNTSLGIFTRVPSEAVSYDSHTPLYELRILGECAAGAGLLHRIAKDDAQAAGELQASFCLGRRMADERLCYTELSDGLGLMSGASVVMAKMAEESGDQAKADQLNQFAASLTTFTNQKLLPIQGVISSIDQATIERNAGDMFWLARNSKERMWRVEALLTLGRLKYNAGHPGDNRGAARVAAEIAKNDPDPVIKTAAGEARDLTLDQYESLH
jgi:hypothetical protein